MADDTEALADAIIAAAESAERRGHSHDEIADALMTAALTIMERRHGPRATGRRLYQLAQRFGADADKSGEL